MESVVKLPIVVAVCGLPRSGSSCLAGVLHHLGIPMGRSWIRPGKANPKGFFEDRMLNHIRQECGGRKIWTNPNIIRPHRTVRLLRQWRRDRNDGSPIIGGKLPPFLARIIPEMNRAWPHDLRILVPERPIMDSAKSAAKGRFWQGRTPKQVHNLFVPVVQKQDADIERLQVPCLRVQFTDLMNHPAEAIATIIAFCGLSPTDEQRMAAISFVDPDLNHHTKTTP